MSSKQQLVLALVVAGAGFFSSAQAEYRETGSFRISGTTTEIFGPILAEEYGSIIAADEAVEWNVFVPDSYDPDRPPGVFVFADPGGWGGMPDQYRQLFAHRNMIWIGVKSNERNPDASKVLLQTYMAKFAIENRYAVDLNRLYIGGSGDEGAQAAIGVQLMANEFYGAVYINGSVYWSAGAPRMLPNLLRKPHVFIIGRSDQRFSTVRNNIENYRKDGIENVKLLQRAGKIRDWPEPEEMDEALAYLDSL